MRTLKKTLALVLVLAMMFSLCAFSASADFTDAEEITYTEAADVMAMIGVIEGMPDGSFDAKGTLTRAQAAVMITRLLDAEDYAIATAGEFTDVPATHWAAGAISFCVNAGIVAGYGDGKFGPSDTLTGYQWAKMLLCALGYSAESEGMTGAAWQIAVARLAKEEGLFAGNLKADKTVPATREEAALYALNLLTATIVKYVGGSSVTVGDITFTSGGVLYDTEEAFMAEYFPKLSCKNDPQTDAAFMADEFGRPGYTWVLTGLKPADTKTVWVGDEAVATYTGAEWTAKEISALEKAGYKFDNAAVLYNGSDWTGGNQSYTDFINKLGATIELYADVDGNITEVVTYEPYAAKVTNIATAKDGKVTVTIEVYEAGYYLGHQNAYKTISINSVDDKADYAVVAGLAKNDIFVGYFAQGWEDSKDIIAIDTFETVTGKVTATSMDRTYNGWLKIDGEQYYFANEYSQAAVANGAEGTFYVYGGYVMHFVATETAAPQYAYVLRAGSEKDKWGKDTFYAELLYTDGTTATVEVKEAATKGQMVSYKTDAATGKIVLSTDGIVNYPLPSASPDAQYELKANTAVQHEKTFNNKSIVVVQTTAADGVTPVYTVYTGVANIPALTCKDIAGAADSTGNVWTVFYAIDATLASAPVTSKDVTYIGDKVSDINEVINNVEVSYSVYRAIVNGEITTVKSRTVLDEGYYSAFTYDANGMITDKTPMTDNEAAKIDVLELVTVTAVAKEGVIMGTLYNDATAVYVIDDATGEISESTISAIEVNDTYLAYTTNGILTMVVFVDNDTVVALG